MTLPVAPDHREKSSYYGRQHLWFIRLRTVAAISAAVSLSLFSTTSTELWLFWVPLTIFIGYLALTHYCTTRKRRVSHVEHRRKVREWRPAAYPSVDVFLPTCGEDLDVLRNTYRHVAQLGYRGQVTVWVLDDAARPEVRTLAAQHWFEYRTRPDRGVMKKAGNLKYGFELSKRDLIVIFDADFCPRPDFIDELVPYLDAPDVAIVQSPQFFDTDKRLGWLQRAAGAVQESFYRWAQVSRDTLGAPICVGTCAIYRRSALERSGGFAQIGHSEDVHTGVNLMKVGYRVVYVPIVLAKGLCPDRLSSFISQQYRWCAGSMSLLRDQKFHDSPLRYRQRMCFFTGFGYYISTAVGVYALSLPTIIMLWFLPDRIQLSNFFWVFPTLALYPIVALVHRTRWTPQTLRVYTISSFAHAAAIWHILRGRTAEWVPSGETRSTSMTSRVTAAMIGWSAATNVLMAVGVWQFLASGRSLVDVAPVIFYTFMSAYIWMPIATMAWQQRTVRVPAVAPVRRRSRPTPHPVLDLRAPALVEA